MLSVDPTASDVKFVAASRDAEVFAERLRRQGQCVIRTKTSYWHSEGWGIYQWFPYHWLIEPSAKELRYLFFDKRVLALRYCQATRVTGHQMHIQWNEVPRCSGYG